MRTTSLAGWTVTICAAVLVLLAAGCGDDSGNTTPDASAPDAAPPDAGALTDGQVSPDGSVTTGEASDLTVDLHAANLYAYQLADLSTQADYTGTDWDFSVTKAMPNPPTFLLGPGVTAVNLGSATAFHAVTQAPDTGYDDDDPDPIIGISWQDGGSGTTGFQVTANVYVLHLADGTYAKVEVLSAQEGKVVVRVYRQADSTRNLATTP